MALGKSFVRAAALLAALAAPAAGAQTGPERGGAIAHASGGIGVDEQERLLAREKEFNLKLVFSLVQGNYVADVAVKIADAKGRSLLEHLAPGPFFLARLPAGQYTVAATYEGRTLTRKVKLAEGRLRTEYLRWPANPETDSPVSRWLDPDGEPPRRAGPPAEKR
ncbi:MAG TPA: carboxypeptidase regulatory-like domain-containing protein [Burkholderiales bacterium]|nr:carboxypeptidase regulatory-like domain-containing protein [Burkholderiales bacterium]